MTAPRGVAPTTPELPPALDLEAARERGDQLAADPDPAARGDGLLITALLARVRQLERRDAVRIADAEVTT